MSSTEDTPTPGETETPTETETPAQTAGPSQLPLAGDGPNTGRRFGKGWRYAVGAAIMVVVAGAFFTIGWFTSAAGDHDRDDREIEFGRQIAPGDRDSRQGGSDWRGTGQHQRQRCPLGQSQPNGPSGQQPPANQQPPSTQQPPATQKPPATQQPPFGQQRPSDQQAPSGQQVYLGVRIVTLTPALQQQFGLSNATGVLVASVDRSGPAAQAGLQRGDVITSIDGTPMSAQQDVTNLLAKKNAGDTVSVAVDRNGQSLTLQVTLAARPATAS